MARQTPDTTSVTVAISGSGGAGAITAGGLLLDAAGKAGLYGLLTRSVGPQIRGGEAAAILRLASHAVEAADDACDVLFAMDWRNIDRFFAELPLGRESLVIADQAAGEPPAAIVATGATIVPLPIAEHLSAIEGGRANMFALGAVAATVGLSAHALDRAIESGIGAKGEGAVDAGRRAAAAGREAMAPDEARFAVSSSKAGKQRWSISGNEAVGLGAIRGGIRFVAAYPITPATEVLEWMAPALAKVGGTLVQAEDELASINMIVGASYGGVPALTATSGPGLALMTEAIGLATATETPIVVVDVMRGGPSTGIPTKTEQSDLNIAIYGPHGDAPHIVVAPTSVADSLFTAQWAVHLAEAMQVPAIVLSDQFIGQARAVIDEPADIAFMARRQVWTTAAEAPYRRYAITPSGISPMALPGTPGGQYIADGLTHTELATPSTGAADHLTQLDKRKTKIDAFDYGDHWADIDGEGDLAIIAWGSCAAAAREAAERLSARGMPVKLIAMRLLSPARPAAFARALAGTTRALIVEQSHSAQFHHYLRAHYDLPAAVSVLHRPGPLSIRPGEIVERIVEGV